MKYFWLCAFAIFSGIIDSSFFILGSFNFLIGILSLISFYILKKSHYALIFAFTYGIVIDLFIKNGIGFSSLVLMLLTWICIEIRENIKINQFLSDVIFPLIYLCFLLLFIKSRFNSFDITKTIKSIDIYFFLSLIIYIIIFLTIIRVNTPKRKT